MTKAIHFQGAGPLEVFPMRWAKEEGLHVIASDLNPHAPGLAIADEVLPTHASPFPKYCSWLKDPLSKKQMRRLVETDPRVLQPKWIAGDLIVKPIESSGSVGAHRSDGTIAEERVTGRHIDANGLFLDGRFYGVGIMEKWENENHLPLRGCEVFPHLYDDCEDPDYWYTALERAARACGYDADGPVKADFIGKYLIEVSPRFHGDVATIGACALGSGINGPRMWFRWLATGEIEWEFSLTRIDRVGAWRVMPPGCAPLEHPQVTAVYRRPIDIADCHDRDTTGIQGYVCAWGTTADEAFAILDEVCGEEASNQEAP